MSDKNGSYYCDRCGKYHGFDTNMGLNHTKYAKYLSPEQIAVKYPNRMHLWIT